MYTCSRLVTRGSSWKERTATACKMATNQDIQKLFRNILKHKFVGVYSLHRGIEKIKKLPENKCIILNTSCKMYGDGHFISVMRSNKGSMIIFDPLGEISLIRLLLQPVIKSFSKVYIYANKIQHKNSEFCSLFCGAFLTAEFNEKGKNRIANFFKLFNYQETELNDDIVRRYLERYLLRRGV